METNLLRSANSDQQSPYWDSSGALFNVEQPNRIPAYMKPYSNEVSLNGSVPFYTFTGLPQLRESQPNEVHNWSYCLPRFRQAFAPLVNAIPKEKLPEGAVDEVGGHASAKLGTGCAQKRFLVFDQSGDHTTLLYSSEIGTRVPCLNSWSPKTPVVPNWLKEEPRIDQEKLSHLGPFLNDEENEKDDTESEMHEDTEELNALLYSDDDSDDPEDEEETSTGHSPSTMTAHDMHDLIVEKGEEVASSGGSTKRQKLLHGGYDAALMDTASSLKCDARSELEDDAESSCVKGGQVARESGYISCKKRLRKEYIHETIRTLQTIIPDGKGKDAMDIIDEAINYLKSLKAKAIDLGLDTL